MHLCWQLLERLETDLYKPNILWLDPPEPHWLMKPSDYAICLAQDVNATSPCPTYLPNQKIPEPVHLAVLFYPKAKNRLEWWLRQIDQMGLNCPIWIVGEIKAGIKSLPKRSGLYLETEKLDSARHCVAFQCQLTSRPPEVDEWTGFSHQGQRIKALPGVFSQHKMDAGTALLLDTLTPQKGHIFELGCGAGVIPLTLLGKNTSCHMVTTDIDFLAVESTRINLEHAGLETRCNVYWSDGFSQVPEQMFDTLITNPPFHVGVKTHYAASERFFAESERWLKARGELWWVANDFLDYQSNLGSRFKKIEEISRRNGYRVFRAIKS